MSLLIPPDCQSIRTRLPVLGCTTGAGLHSFEKASLYVRATLPKAAMMMATTISTNHPILLREITKRLLTQLPLRCIPYTKVTVLPIGDIPLPTRVTASVFN
jgi:hypothetical protein